MSFPTVVSWSWGAERYHAAARRLIKRCEELGYPHDVEVGADLSQHLARFERMRGPHWTQRQWVYRFIPGFLLSKRREHAGPLLYLHADMTFRRPVPEERFRADADVMLESGWSQDPPRPHDRVLAGPIYLAPTRGASRFLRLWSAFCAELDDGRGEHEQLIRTWQLMRDRDRSLTVETWNPPLASIRASDDVAIVGDK